MKEEKDPRGAKEDLFPREVSVNRARIEERLLATEILSLNFQSPRTDVSAEEMPLAKTASKVRASARTRVRVIIVRFILIQLLYDLISVGRDCCSPLSMVEL